DKIIYERASQTNKNESKAMMRDISSPRSTYWSPSRDKTRENRTKVVICSVCGTQVKMKNEGQKFCPTCGEKLF
ncbi:MAG: hypothetical protein ACTSU4_02325, partial [Promethearchaeota archaeon]